jgi:hypothetical protein
LPGGSRGLGDVYKRQVLTRILNEEIGLCDGDNEPYYNYIKEETVVS